MTQRFLETWHKMVAARDAHVLAGLVADDVKIYSPAFWKPKEGKPAVLAIMNAVMRVVSDFRYSGELVQGNEIVLLFEGSVGGKSLRGIDRIELDEQGRMAVIEVFVRPKNGLELLAQEMARELTPG